MFLTQTISPLDYEDMLPECVIELIEYCSEAIKSFCQRMQPPTSQPGRQVTASASVAAKASDVAPSIKRRVVVEPPPRLTRDETEPSIKRPTSSAFYVPPPPLSSPVEAALSL